MLFSLRSPWASPATFLAVWAALAQVCLAGPVVTIGMRAAFPAPPFLLELVETAAQENSTSFFPLIDRISEGYFTAATTDRDLYEGFLTLLSTDGHIGTAESLSTFKLALSTRSAAPRIEAHGQYYRTAVASILPQGESGCSDWASLAGEGYCGSLLEAPAFSVSTLKNQDLPFDRVVGQGPDCVLYTDLSTPAFWPLHASLRKKQQAGECTYKIRYISDASATHGALPVNGFGVELALKRTDYIVIDDREASNGAAQAPLVSADILNRDVEADVADLRPLSKSEVSALGSKTATFILESENPLSALLAISQDFPKQSTALAAHNVSSDFLSEHRANRVKMVPSGMNVLWLNGAQLIERQIDAYSLVDLLRRERKLIQGVMALGMSGKDAVALLGHSAIATAKTEVELPRFDWRDSDEGENVIIWLNDLEKDKRYSDFPSSLMSMLQQGMPGQIPQIRRDIFNLIFPVDFGNFDDVVLVVMQLQDFVKRKLPIRFGLVPLSPVEASSQQAKVVYHLYETYGIAAMMDYLRMIIDGRSLRQAEAGVFDSAIAAKEPRMNRSAMSLPELLEHAESQQRLALAKQWSDRLRVDGSSPIVLVDGIIISRTDNWMQPMSQQLGTDLRVVQEAIVYGQIEEGAWIPALFLKQAAKRRNVLLHPENSKDLSILDMNKLYSEHEDLLSAISIVPADLETAKEIGAVLTIVADLTTEVGEKLAVSSLQFRASNPGVQIEIIHSPIDSSEAYKLNSALSAAGDRLSSAVSVDSLQSLLVVESDRKADQAFDLALSRFLNTAKIAPGQNVAILNGRMLGPITPTAYLEAADFDAFLAMEQTQRIQPLYEALRDLNMEEKLVNPRAVSKISSIVALSSISDIPAGVFESPSTLRMDPSKIWNSTHTSFEVGDEGTAIMHFVVSLDPASEQGQRWAPILRVLSELSGVFLRVFLNPKERLDDLPVKRFYRYVLDAAPTFDEAGKIVPLAAKFKGLPSEALLNVGLDVPPAWLVAPKNSIHDLDNLKLSTTKGDVEATYELENILIEGHSRQADTTTPRGVQLILSSESGSRIADTMIMANIGYFQFKANPGLYDIQLQAGRSTELFTIESVGAKGFTATPGDEGTQVVLMDFMGTTLYPRINRNPGMELEDVLSDSESDGSVKGLVTKGLKYAEGIWASAKNKKEMAAAKQADINIFSVASGHLYERMLNIMMVSVMRHTKHTVKFWFIEQFLSPSFKEFIPAMAEEYGFQYEMVTYKWPHWLRQQKEKQREIWGYKILFLDVLFPLSLDKVIFVDADQIVRTDMYSLIQLDLQGAPYGFTPMCDSRIEMEGFRFWKQGYWANYLRGQPYHISALYVVDLKRFRELAAGDRLRQTYQALSADPASLSNLDQDLPNHMQFQIPIHSLPQEWLWCETWCSDEALDQAKTIDLCNNPQTKEPKLDRARRQVPEWNVYDGEIAALFERSKASKVEGAPVSATTEETLKNVRSRRFEEASLTSRKDEL